MQSRRRDRRTLREHMCDLLDVPADLPRVDSFRYKARHANEESRSECDIQVGIQVC